MLLWCVSAIMRPAAGMHNLPGRAHGWLGACHVQRDMAGRARVELGKWGEDCACRELQRRGYAILARRHRTRFGEIDIIARHRGVLVFVEVKARRSTSHGAPAEALTWHKQRKLLQLAAAYLAETRVRDQPCRFDVVSVSITPGGAGPRVDVLQNAFASS
jgi:putative endonuclease